MEKQNSVLKNSQEGENPSPSSSGKPELAGSSQEPNKCSVPKGNTKSIENNNDENQPSLTFEEQAQKCKHDLETMTGKALNMLYPKEYKTWSNSKNRSKLLKGIDGPQWGTELNSFPGFLREVGPCPDPDYSLDRIDPSFGYVMGNIRWASKQLQSENRKNVDQIMVHGRPMTKPRLADLLGISYDALRMRLSRGDDIEKIVAEHLKPVTPVKKSLAAKIEACPWPEEKAQAWEAAFKAERHLLLQAPDRDSRTAFFVAKCAQKFRQINEDGREYAEQHDPDEPIPDEWLKKYSYWKQLLRFASEQRALVVPPEPAPVPYNLEPSEGELEMIEAFSGSPPDITDEDLHRRD